MAKDRHIPTKYVPQQYDEPLFENMATLTTNSPPARYIWRRLIAPLIAVGIFSVLGACTKSTDALETSEQNPTSEVVANKDKVTDGEVLDKEKSGANIIRRKSTVSKKGTNIRVLVNRVPITNYDIQRRASFLRLRRIGGNRTQKATEELVNEKIKLQEATDRRTRASDTMVDTAFADFAKRNKMSARQMASIMNQSGVTSKHFKEFLRAQISWQRTVGAKFQSNTREQSQSDALFSIRKSGKAKPETREYILQQIIFVVPAAKRKALLRQRVSEAKAFRQRFTNCADTLNQVKNLRDVAFKNLGRMLEPELPLRWKEDIIKTAVQSATVVKETEKGVEFIAVCSVRNVSDDRAAEIVTKANKFSALNVEGDKIGDEYLRELRGKATIVYR